MNVGENLTNLTRSNLTNTSEYAELVDRYNSVSFNYTLLIAAVVFFNFTKTIVFYYFTTCASIRLHNDTFNKVMTATMEFFDTHMTGNILNRFAKDIRVIDEQLPHVIFSVVKVNLI